MWAKSPYKTFVARFSVLCVVPFFLAAITLHGQVSRQSALPLYPKTTNPSTWPLLDLRAAAEEGSRDAELELGRRYLAGRGVPRDRVTAYSWFNIAAGRGSTVSATERDQLERTLMPSQVAEAEALSRDWAPKEAIETPSLRAVFSGQLNLLLLSARNEFKEIATTSPQAKGQYGNNTRIRFPGRSSLPCSVGLSNIPAMLCTIFQTAKGTEAARLFFQSVVAQVWDILGGTEKGWKWGRPTCCGGSISDSIDFTATRRVCSEDYCPAVALSLDTDGMAAEIKLFIHSKGGCAQCDPQQQPPPNFAPNSSIRAQIDAVEREGHYLGLPQATGSVRADLQPGVCIHTIENRTPYTLDIFVAGPMERQIQLAASSRQDVELPSGPYKIVGRASSANVLPFFGEQRCGSASAYVSIFEIQQR
jgi:hypothetical protein